MKKHRKVFLFIVLSAVIVLCAIGGGLWWFYQNSGSRLLQKVNLAIKANRADKALDLAGRYIQQRPGDWLGYSAQAQAYLSSAKYDEARRSLEQAARVSPSEVSVGLLTAETYSMPARQAAASRDLASLRQGVDQYAKACDILLKLQPADEKKVLDVQTRLGLTQIEAAKALQVLGTHLEDEALAAEAKRDTAARDTLRKEGKDAQAKATEALELTTQGLLAVVARDASREEAATALVRLCLDRQDRASLVAARSAILGLKDPPPVAATMLVIDELSYSPEGPAPLDKQKAASACGVLEEILKKHPENIQVKLTRADLAVRLSDLQTAQRLCEEALKVDARDPRARLLEGDILIAQGNLAEAERKLSGLKAEAGNILEVQFAWAKVCLALGKTEAAREALRTMAKLGSTDSRARLMQVQLALALSDLPTARQICEETLRSEPGNAGALLLHGKALAMSGNLAGAQRELSALKAACPNWPEAQLAFAQLASQKGDLSAAQAAAQEAVRLDPGNAQAARLLAEVQLRQGSYDKAFEGAQTYYQSHKGDPDAMSLLVGSALRANQTQLARQALEQAAAENASGPEMLMAVSEGYSALNDRDAALKAARRAADIAPSTPEARLAVAQAYLLIDRVPEAESLLAEEVKRDPGRAGVHLRLGQLYASTGRPLPAIDQYRLAADLDKGNMAYQIVLARALLDSGELAESGKILDSLPSSSPAAEMLRLQIRLIQGQPINVSQVLQQAQGYERSALATAMPYLASGQLQECAKFCEAELAKKPDDLDLRMLLARALGGMGQQDRAMEQWGRVVQMAPDRLSTYMELAGMLARSGNPETVDERMAGMPGARPEMVDLAAGQVLASAGKADKAVVVLERAANRSDAPEHVQGRARLLLAQVLAATGKADGALAELDRLAGTARFRREATLAKVGVLLGARRLADAEAILTELTKSAVDQKDTTALRATAELYSRLGRHDKALAVCDQLEALAPTDPRTPQLRAMVLLEAKRPAEAADSYRKAIELQPQNISLHLELARTLDEDQRFTEALEVLRKLADAGPAAASVALFQEGALYARWGLQDQAADCFAKLSGMGYGGNPGVRLALGRAFAALGQLERAGDSLGEVPQYAPEYVPARLLMARMAKTLDDKLAILRALQQAKPGGQEAIMEEMGALLGAGRAPEAIKTYRSFVDKYGKKNVSPDASFLAVQAFLDAKDLAGAREIALEVARDSGQLRWRHLAALLLLDDDPQAAAGILPQVDQADAVSAMIGLCVARPAGDAAAEARWLDRLAQLEKQLGEAEVATLLPARLLISVMTGDQDQAKAALARTTGILGLGKGMMSELAASALANPKGKEEARVLLKASIALGIGVPTLAEVWAIEALRARPTCQWAAALAFHSDTQRKSREEILKLLEPKDCVLARLLAAEMLQSNNEFAKAAELLKTAAQGGDGEPEALLSQAVNTEYAGKLEEALALYRQVWQASKIPAAANNVAYVTLRLYPKDQAKLAEAQGLAEEAVRQRPQEASFRDTLGWIAYLQGRDAKARTELRRAIEGMPQSPEVHYHLAMAESACGSLDLARWHHAAAINIGKVLTAQGKPLPAETAQVVKLSQQALDALGPAK